MVVRVRLVVGDKVELAERIPVAGVDVTSQQFLQRIVIVRLRKGNPVLGVVGKADTVLYAWTVVPLAVPRAPRMRGNRPLDGSPGVT